MNGMGNIVFLVPIVAIIFGTGMITAITVSVIRAVSGPKKGAQPDVSGRTLARLKELEERLSVQDGEIKKLQEEHSFVVKLLEQGREAE
jgi:Sec-independent protein translocase protein TatA